jgi:hypothetical protein
VSGVRPKDKTINYVKVSTLHIKGMKEMEKAGKAMRETEGSMRDEGSKLILRFLT